MDHSPISITRNGVKRPFGLDLVCSGFLVEDGKVLLVLHKRFEKWVPPGGHIEPQETFAQAACREFREETGLQVEAVSSGRFDFNDANATTEPLPFHVDVLLAGFPRPTLTQYFFVRRSPGSDGTIKPQQTEVKAAEWFARHDLPSLPTFDQVRSLADFAIRSHPSATAHESDRVQK
jgi:8-oxo-dGTP pyrophosphatase MutT (NUDIX family)